MQAVPRSRRRRSVPSNVGTAITPAGLAYMKCVTSPNDFEVDSFQGIPDDYDGRIIVKKHQAVSNMATPTAGNDAYIVLLPTPGVAYWYGSRATSSTAAITLTPVYYSDFTTLFPTGDEQSVVSAFRYASNVIEIVPTVNAMSWGGAIEVWKSPVTGSIGMIQPSGVNYYTVTGMDAMNSTKPQSVLPFNNGAYAVTTCCNAAINFTSTMRASAPAQILAYMDAASTALTFGGANNFVGVGCQDAVFIKMPYSTASNSALIRTWACVEYQVSPSSLLYEYSRLSPPCDPVALQLVRRFLHETPTAVPFYDNAGFWTRFNDWVRRISGALKVVPGPVGDVAGIVNLTSKTISQYI